MKLDDSDAAARLTAGATEVCGRLAITPINVSDSVANASLRAAIGPRSLINSRILARLLLPCSYKAETRSLDLLTETIELPGHLRQKPHHGTGPGGARQRTGALGVGEFCEARGRQLNIRQQSLGCDGVGVGNIEIAGIVLYSDGEMLLDRGG